MRATFSLFFENFVEAVYVRLNPMAVKTGLVHMQGHHVIWPKNTSIPGLMRFRKGSILPRITQRYPIAIELSIQIFFLGGGFNE